MCTVWKKWRVGCSFAPVINMLLCISGVSFSLVRKSPHHNMHCHFFPRCNFFHMSGGGERKWVRRIRLIGQPRELRRGVTYTEREERRNSRQHVPKTTPQGGKKRLSLYYGKRGGEGPRANPTVTCGGCERRRRRHIFCSDLMSQVLGPPADPPASTLLLLRKKISAGKFSALAAPSLIFFFFVKYRLFPSSA